MYHIRPYTHLLAKKVGVTLKPSTKRNYKIDIYKDGVYLTSIGDKRYEDYLSYVENVGYDYANRRRELYLKRHKKDSQVEGSKGYYASRILWAG
jgi:hypothetical protein